MLRENKISEAQNAKEDIEAAQRKDAKLREVNRENKWAGIESLGMIRINFIYINWRKHSCNMREYKIRNLEN